MIANGIYKLRNKRSKVAKSRAIILGKYRSGNISHRDEEEMKITGKYFHRMSNIKLS